jgi:SnoaL-like domain
MEMPDNALDRLVAEQAIRRLISSYCDAVGRLDAASATRLFAPDARVKIADFSELVGRDAIAEGLRQSFAATDLLHQRCDTGLIDVEGARARARLSVFEVNRKPNQDAFGMILGFYEDEYARLTEGWRFYRRRYTLQLRALVPASKIQQVADFIPSAVFAP